MSEEKRGFSWGSFSSTTPDPEPVEELEPVVEPEPAAAVGPVTGGSVADKALSVKRGHSAKFACTQAEADEVFEKTRGLRQQGALRVSYRKGELTVRRVKD